MAANAFDEIARDYDAQFTDTAIGRRMRDAVWRRCDAVFQPGMRVLEINCGTGADAVHLGARGVGVLATDASPEMIEVARAKVRRAGLDHVVGCATLRIEDLDPSLGRFDGVLSNFGGLNCVTDLRAAGLGLASVVRDGGRAVLCVMGPWVPWEWVWFAAHADFQRARRRLHRRGTPWRSLTVGYPSVRTLRNALSPEFRATRVSAVCALVPPPFAEPWARRHPRLVNALDRVERAAETRWPLPSLADHYVVELERVHP
jgi:SAM-dependent methyltransferase